VAFKTKSKSLTPSAVPSHQTFIEKAQIVLTGIGLSQTQVLSLKERTMSYGFGSKGSTAQL